MSTTTLPAPVVETSPEVTLELHRCDRCGAQGKVHYALPSGNDLVFCQHHSDQYEADLVAAQAVAVQLAAF